MPSSGKAFKVALHAWYVTVPRSVTDSDQMIECYQAEIFFHWSTDAACAAPNQQRPGQSEYQGDSGSITM